MRHGHHHHHSSLEAGGNTFNITIINNTGEDQQYVLFQPYPTQTGQPSSSIFRNAYQSSAIVPKNHRASANFTITEQWYAICGTAPNPLNPNVKVSTSEYEAVTLTSAGAPGTKLQMTTINNDGEDPEFNDAATTTTTTNEAYQIFCDGSFSIPNQSK